MESGEAASVVLYAGATIPKRTKVVDDAAPRPGAPRAARIIERALLVSDHHLDCLLALRPPCFLNPQAIASHGYNATTRIYTDDHSAGTTAGAGGVGGARTTVGGADACTEINACEEGYPDFKEELVDGLVQSRWSVLYRYLCAMANLPQWRWMRRRSSNIISRISITTTTRTLRGLTPQ
jgi:hypothetical protein